MKVKKKVGIVGMGYVGKAMYQFFAKHYDVLPYDKNQQDERTFPIHVSKEEINTCDVGVVCVPTPSCDTNRCDTSIVEEVIDWLNTPLIIIKSTVEPGTTDKLKAKYPDKHIVFSPEYCGESTYWSPYKWDREVKETPFFIFGGDPIDTTRAVSLYLPVTGPVKQYRQTTALAAELAKYMENCFYAMKVTFCYEMANVIEKAGSDWNEVRELWLLDPRINPMHTAVFPENNKPFGGKCLIYGTKVSTPSGFKNIENLVEGDILMDFKGNCVVTGRYERFVDRVIGITARGRKIIGSEDHIHMIYDKEKIIEKKLNEINLGENIFIPEVEDVGINSVKLDKKPNNYVKWWPEELKIDKSLARVLGLYSAEGCSSDDEVHWSFGEHELNLAEEVSEVLSNLGLNPSIRLQITEGTFGESRCQIVRIRSKGFCNLLKNLGMGKNALNKNSPIFSRDLIPSYIGGWLDGDGSHYDGTIAGHSESKNLIMSLDRMMINLGILPQISECGKDLKISTRADVEKVCSWTKKMKFNSERYVRGFPYLSPTFRKVEKGWAVKITKIEELSGQQVVAIETSSGTYIANNILTHNCFPKDLKAMAAYAESLGYSPELLKEVLDSNERIGKYREERNK